MEESDKRVNPVDRAYMANNDFRQRLKEKPKDNKREKKEDKEFLTILRKKYEDKNKGSR